MNTRVLSAATAIALITCAGLLVAGPLDPPAGPVTGTYKTIAEVEPRIAVNSTNTPGAGANIFRITQPGSYYLTGNITGVASRHGIEIAANGVTLDLNGFDVVGVPGSLDGVTVLGGGLNNIAVVNGSVRNWGGDGVDIATAIAINSRVDRVHASGNTGTGILTTSGSTVSNCSAAFNIASGIHTGNGGAVTNSSATGNGEVGISTLGGCSITNCAVYQNSGNGIQVGIGSTIADSSSYDNGGHGMRTDNGCTLSGCSSADNSGGGILAGGTCTVTACSAVNNATFGIATGGNAALTQCSASNNTGVGISCSAGSLVMTCTATDNTGLGFQAAFNSSFTQCLSRTNAQGGFATANGCAVSNCTAINNTGHGIEVTAGCTVADCTTQFNELDGIRCFGNCTIRNNNCSGDGFNAGNGAGIHATANDNRIEGNNCTDADRGIDVDFGGNYIVRNSCSGNSINWDIVANNYYGAIVNRAGIATAFVSGDSAPTALVSTDPHANFTY